MSRSGQVNAVCEAADELFDDLDTNKDGQLSFQEIQRGLEQRRLPASDEIVRELIKRCDSNKDGTISKEEFRNWMQQHEHWLHKQFEEFDTDNSGFVDQHELTLGLIKLGYHPTHSQVRSLISRLDKNGDGQIDFGEFCEALVLLPVCSSASLVEYWQKAVAIDIGEDFYIPPEKKGVLALKYLFCGGVAGAVSRTATAPLDRLKILLQTQHYHGGAPITGVAQGLRKMLAEEGYKGFWRGNGANVYKIFPESGIRFLAYEYYKKLLFNEDSKHLSASQKLLSGGLAGVTSQIAIYPLEVVRARLACSPKNTYKGMMDAFQKTIRQEGLKGLYKGMLPSVMGIFPYAAFDLMIFDSLKTLYINYNHHEPGIGVLLLAGATSSSVGQLASYPLDLVRRRLQVQGMFQHLSTTTSGNAPKPILYTGTTDVIMKTVAQDGFVGLYKGMAPNLLKVVPAVSISYLVYETMKKNLNVP